MDRFFNKVRYNLKLRITNNRLRLMATDDRLRVTATDNKATIINRHNIAFSTTRWIENQFSR